MTIYGDRADVQQPGDGVGPAGIDNIAGGVNDLGLIDRSRAPFPDLGGAVVDDVGAGKRVAEGGRVLQIAPGEFNAELLQERDVAVTPHQSPHALAAAD